MDLVMKSGLAVRANVIDEDGKHVNGLAVVLQLIVKLDLPR
jgi:hypothetical protein